MLISGRLNKDQRRGAGLALLMVGILSSIPLLRWILGKVPVGEDRSAMRERPTNIPSWGEAVAYG